MGAAGGIALHDVVLLAHPVEKRFGGGVRLLLHGDQYEGGDFEPQQALVDDGGVALDEAGLLELLDAPEAGRFRQPDVSGEFDVGHAPVGLK
jgi:hypothetical protein